MLYFRRILAVLCYLILLAADAVSVYAIYLSISGGITYYLGMLIFVPFFIVSYWFSTFFMQLTEGKVCGKKIMPKWLRLSLNLLSTIISVALVGFWGYIYILQQMNPAVNENLVEHDVKVFLFR